MNLSTFYRVWSLDHLSTTQPADEACSESLHVRLSKTVLDSGFHALSSRFQVLDSVFIVSRTWIRDSNRYRETELLELIPKPMAPDSTCRNFLNSGILITLHGSLRKQRTLSDTTTGFPAKWRLRNEHRNSILMTRHYLDLDSDSDWLNQISQAARPCIQQLYPDLSSDASSVWDFCARFSDVIWQGN